MGELIITAGQSDRAIAIMREVAAWGRDQGFRVWPDAWLTREELMTGEVGPENFYVGTVGGQDACAFVLQWSDREYWPEARPYEAAYLHKFCVRRAFTHSGMTGRVVEALRQECAPRGVRFLRLDTGADEPVVRDIYLKAGFQIVKTLCDHATPSMLLYELEL